MAQKCEARNAHRRLGAYEMKGIYSSCISKDTLDEAPFAYRDIESIKEVVSDTIMIDKVIKPIYNFKAGM